MSNVLKDKLLRVVVGTSLAGAIIFAESDVSAQLPDLTQPVFEGAEVVEFESVFYTYPPSPFKVKQAEKLGIELELITEPSIRLTGYLAKPEGEGPFPAVVFMHGCEGIWEATEVWSDRLVAWGYVVLSVDSLTPRGEKYICGRITAANYWVRVLDAYGAKRYLSTRPFVDPTRIAVMGMGYGGDAVLRSIKQSTSTGLDMRPFRAAVAFYPICGEPEQIDTPTLVLIGSADHWGTWAEDCVRYLDRLPPPHEMTLKVFPGAHHVFDHPGLDFEDNGLIVRSDPEAAAEAIRMTREFLSERLE